MNDFEEEIIKEQNEEIDDEKENEEKSESEPSIDIVLSLEPFLMLLVSSFINGNSDKSYSQ